MKKRKNRTRSKEVRNLRAHQELSMLVTYSVWGPKGETQSGLTLAEVKALPADWKITGWVNPQAPYAFQTEAKQDNEHGLQPWDDIDTHGRQ